MDKLPPPNISRTCSICDKFGAFKYYGAMSCEGCKQFFYRTILKKKYYSCNNNGCPIKCRPITSIIYCKACRLEKCLQVGMNPRLINGGEDYMDQFKCRKLGKLEKNKILEKILKHPSAGGLGSSSTTSCSRGMQPMIGIGTTNTLQILAEKQNIGQNEVEIIIYDENEEKQKNQKAKQNISSISIEQILDMNILMSLKVAEQRYKLLFEHPIGISAEQKSGMDIFTDLRHFLLAKYNSLNFRFGGINFGDLKDLASTTNYKDWASNYTTTLNVIARHLLLVIELAKTMPSFGNLTLDDQELLLSNVVQPVLQFNTAFYSWENNRKTMVYNGVDMNNFGRCLNDGTINKLNSLIRVEFVAKFHEIGLDQEELLLIRAIILSHSATSGLSPAGCDLLQQQANKFAGILLKLLQKRTDSLAGARKYMEAMQLVQATFRTAQYYYEYLNYIDIFYHPKVIEKTMPKFLIPFCI